jgi:hypothetical protein
VNAWINEGRAEGKAEGKAEDVLDVLRARFQTVPDDVEARVRASVDLQQLTRWLIAAATALSLDSFRQAL